MAGENRILLVEDDPDIQELIDFNLTREGYRVDKFFSGEEALRRLGSESVLLPNLIILDLMLPGMDGLDICRRIRSDRRMREMRILMLTAKGEEADVVVGLETGADDYVLKPFSPRVLLARIRSLLRRPREESPETVEPEIRIHELTIRPGRHEVLLREHPVTLTAGEFRILNTMARKPGWVFTRGQLVSSVHGEDYIVTERSIDVMVVGLRKKLGSSGRFIETVRGVGYRFRD